MSVSRASLRLCDVCLLLPGHHSQSSRRRLPRSPSRTIYMLDNMSLYPQEWPFYDAAIDSIGDSGGGRDDRQTVAAARAFLAATAPSFLLSLDRSGDPKSAHDRLVKVGRNVAATLAPGGTGKDSRVMWEKADGSLHRLVAECKALAGIIDGTERRKVPTVRFGRTGLRVPIVTLGCMRFQESWNRGKGKPVKKMDQVSRECQDNLVRIIRYALSVGVNHIETASMYGSSELQLGSALGKVLASGEVRREDLIVQTKGQISASATPAQFRQAILAQIERLGVGYIDLYSVHGCNTAGHFEWLYNNGERGNLVEVLRDMKKEGLIRHYGFSTHAPAEVIHRLIRDGDFDYVNLHHHFCGDYTSSGDMDCGGNLDNVRLARSKDMGVFVISPYDKGGRLYTPTKRLRNLTLPEFEPMEYGSMWLWHHDRLDPEGAAVHTITVGAARPSDLDQPLYAALRSHECDYRENVTAVADRIRRAEVAELGEDWLRTWSVGLPNCHGSERGTQIGNIVWLHNAIRVYGVLDYAKERYANMEANLAKWNDGRTREANLNAMNNWMPGCAYEVGRDYTADLKDCPPENVKKVKEAMEFVHKWCSKKEGDRIHSDEEKKEEKLEVPDDWQIAYDMRPWTAFPERP